MNLTLKIGIEGADQIIMKLDDLESRLKSVHGRHSVTLAELFSPEFMQKHTKFKTFDELLTASGFNVESATDFKDIPNDKWDAYIAKSTSFATWNTMLEIAAKEWVANKINPEQKYS